MFETSQQLLEQLEREYAKGDRHLQTLLAKQARERAQQIVYKTYDPCNQPSYQPAPQQQAGMSAADSAAWNAWAEKMISDAIIRERDELLDDIDEALLSICRETKALRERVTKLETEVAVARGVVDGAVEIFPPKKSASDAA